MQRYVSALQTLAYCSKVSVVNEDTSGAAVPNGCAIITVSDKCEGHLLLKGLIEPAKEIAKIQKKIESLLGTQTKLNGAMNAVDYQIKVPEEVRHNNEEKLLQTGTELERLQVAIEALKLME